MEGLEKMSAYKQIREGVSTGVSELKENVDDVYHRDFGKGPLKISIKDVFGKAYKYLEPPDSTISKKDKNIGAQTVSLIAKSNSAYDQENFISMFDRLDGNLFNGSIDTGTKKKKILAPFSTYTPTVIWPYQRDDGGRYTVHDLARKDIGIPDWVAKPLSVMIKKDLDIDEDGKADYGGLPLFNWVADPVMGIGPILLTAALGFIAFNIVTAAGPLVLSPV